MDDPILVVEEIRGDAVRTDDLIMGMLDSLGCRVGSMSGHGRWDVAFSRDWEWFNPALVEYPEDLPQHWLLVWQMHTSRPECGKIGYHYFHAPKPILGGYPRVPMRGIFATCASRPEEVKPNDIFNINEEVFDGLAEALKVEDE